LMGANTYRLMSEFAAQSEANDAEEAGALEELTTSPKVVFSSTLTPPLSWANSRLESGDAAKAVEEIRQDGVNMRTIGSVSLCRSLLTAGLVDRFRVVVFPVITGSTGRERIYDDYPDVALEMTGHRTFDGRIQLLEYAPTVLAGPPDTDET